MTSEDITPVTDVSLETVALTKSAAQLYPALRLEEGVGSYYATVSNLDTMLDDLPDAEGLMDYTGKPITVHGATLRLGETDERMTVYAVIDITDDSTGRRVAATTGASAVLGQLNKAAAEGWFPFQCMPYQTKLNKKGRTDPLHLGKVDRY